MKLFFAMMFMCSAAFAQEQITSFTDESLPVLNEELRKSIEGIGAARSGDSAVQERIEKINDRLEKIEVAMQNNRTEIVNICQLADTSFTRSLTYSGTFTQTGSAGDEVDGDAATAYGGSASVSSGTASVTFSETITFSKTYSVSSVYFKALAGGGGSSGGGGTMYLKLINSVGGVIATLFSNTAVTSVSDNTTYTTEWDDVKQIEFYGKGEGGGQYGGSGSVLSYEIQAYASVKI